MKNILHKLCIRLKLYREIYNGHFDIVKTLAGTYFIDGNYAPLTLKRCIELERGYHQECYMKMEHDVQKNTPSKALIGAGVGAAALLMTGCNDIEKVDSANGTLLPPNPIRVPDPPHS